MPRHRTVRPGTASQRQLRVGEAIRHAMAGLLARGEVHDDVLASRSVTVSEVRMTPDLRLATAFVVSLGGGDPEPILAALVRHKRFVRGRIARAVNLKFAPDIRFVADQMFDEASRIERLLDTPQVRRDLDAPKEDEED